MVSGGEAKRGHENILRGYTRACAGAGEGEGNGCGEHGSGSKACRTLKWSHEWKTSKSLGLRLSYVVARSAERRGPPLVDVIKSLSNIVP